MTKKAYCSVHGEYYSENIARVADQIIWTKCPKCIKDQIHGKEKNIAIYEELIQLRKRIEELEAIIEEAKE